MVKTKINSFDINNNYIINVKNFNKLIEVFKYLCQKALENNDKYVVIENNFKTLTKEFWNKIKISLPLEGKRKFNFIWTGDTSLFNYKLNTINNLNCIKVKKSSIQVILDSKNKEWQVTTLVKLANIFASSKKYILDEDVQYILAKNLLENWRNIKYKNIKYSFSFYERISKNMKGERKAELAKLVNALIISPNGALTPVRENNSYEGKSIVERKINTFLINVFIYLNSKFTTEHTFLVNIMDPNAGPVMENNTFRKEERLVRYTRYHMSIPPFEGVETKINNVGRRFNLESGEIEDIFEVREGLEDVINSTFKKVDGFQPLNSKAPKEPTSKEKDLAKLAGTDPEAAEEAIWLLDNNYYNELLPAEEAIELATNYGYTAIVEAINKAVENGKVLRYEEDLVLFGNEIYFEDEAADSSSIEEYGNFTQMWEVEPDEEDE